MKVKKLLNYLVFGLMLVALVSLAAVVVIMASTQQSINSSIIVTYKPTHVNGTASARYYLGSSGDAVDFETDGGDTVLDFNENSPNDGYQLNQVGKDPILLSEGETFVVYEYEFTNRAENPYVVDFSINLTTFSGVKMQTYVSETQMTDRVAWTTVAKEAEKTGTFKFIVPPKPANDAVGRLFAYIRFDISDPDSPSEVEGGFELNLYGSGVELKKLYEIDGTKVTGLTSGASNLNNLVFPSDTTEISGTFGGDSITSVHIGKQLSTISSGAFSNLTDIREVTIDNETIFKNIKQDGSLLKYASEDEFVVRVINTFSGSDYLNDTYFDIQSGNPYNTYTQKPGSELWKASEKKFNTGSLNNLLKQITGNDSASISNMKPVNDAVTTVKTSQDLRDINGGEDIVVTLGGYEWTATFLSTDKTGNVILTLWLDDSYQLSGGRYGASGVFNEKGTTTWAASGSTSNIYETSYMRTVVLNNGGEYAPSGTAQQYDDSVFAMFTMEKFGLTRYIVTPSDVIWQQQGQSAQRYYFGTQPPMEDLKNENWGDGNGEWKNDYLWLPSLSEVGFGRFESVWKTTDEQRCNAEDPHSYLWTRSGRYTYKNQVYCVSGWDGGRGTSYEVDSETYAVRPAVHLNLTLIAGAQPTNPVLPPEPPVIPEVNSSFDRIVCSAGPVTLRGELPALNFPHNIIHPEATDVCLNFTINIIDSSFNEYTTTGWDNIYFEDDFLSQLQYIKQRGDSAIYTYTFKMELSLFTIPDRYEYNGGYTVSLYGGNVHDFHPGNFEYVSQDDLVSEYTYSHYTFTFSVAITGEQIINMINSQTPLCASVELSIM